VVVKIQNRTFGVIASMRNHVVRRFTQLELNERNELEWKVSARASDGAIMTWFIVQGMKDGADVERFFEDPQKWTWAQFTSRLYARGHTGLYLNLCRRGSPVYARGLVVGPPGKQPQGMWFTMHTLPGGKRRPGEEPLRTTVGFEPKSGAIWIQSPEPIPADLSFLDMRPLQDAKEGLPPIRDFPICKGKRFRLRVPVESRLRGRIHGPPEGMHIEIQARLTPVSLPGKALYQAVTSEFRFAGLAAGTYDLEFTTPSPEDVLIKAKRLTLEEGETKTLDGVFDVMPKLQKVELGTVDPEGQWMRVTWDRFYPHPWHTQGRRIFHGRARPWQTLVGPRGGCFIASTKGGALRLLHGIRKDTKIAIYPVHHLTVTLVGLPKVLLQRRWSMLRAEPPGGYPDWAWEQFQMRGRAIPSARSPTRQRPGHRISYCQTQIRSEAPVTLHLTRPTHWSLSLRVDGRTFSIADPIAVTKVSQSVEVTIPPEVVQKIKDHLARRRGR